MSMLKLLRILPFLACAAIAGPAFAGPILGIMFSESGFPTFSTSGTNDPLIVNQSYGTFSTNAEVTTLVENPLALDLSSVNISTSAGGTLIITASASDLLAPNGLVDFVSQFSGHAVFGDTSLTFQTYLDNTNTLFGTQTPLSLYMAAGSPYVFLGDTGPIIPTTAPFALTEVLTITTNGSADLSLDGSVTGQCLPGIPTCSTNPPLDVPEPGSLIMLGSALVGLGGIGWYRRRQGGAAAA